ncbi:MAG: hypothetical protein GY705_20170, partial [Bacteroidetes bacterium]|nr:hypothetical protein [Bacteroidota bacterium]
MILKNFSCSILIIAISCLSLNGQTLIQDAKNLLKAIDVLENQTEDTPDSVLIAASSEALALLNFHDQTFEMDSMKTGLWEDIKHSYARNSTINKLIRDPYFSIADSEKSTVLIQSNLFSEKIASGPRQKMLNLLKAEYAVSPSDYLSISSTLEKYRIPPISKIQALKATTANNNNNITNGILTSQAAVIEGLYRFILERAKKEVLINFLEELLNEETPRFRKLFPTVVEEFGNQEFTYSASFIQRLRQAFYEDIQMLSINLPVLFLEDDHFNSLQSSPVSYNFLVIFSMIGLAQHAVPIEEIIPLTHRYLFQNYEEATKVVNLELAEKAPDADSYEELIAISRSIVGQLKIIYNEFDKAEEAIVEAVKASEDNFPDAPSAPFVNDYLSRSEYDLEVILGSGDTGNEFDLSLLPYLLKGELDSAYMAQYNTIASYDHFFEKQYTSREWRAAGLEISNKLAGNWYRGQSITDIFYRWQKDLTHFQLAVDRWKSEIDPDSELQRAIEQTETDRIKLLEVTLASKEFWLPSLSQHNKLAFNSLANLITEDVFFDIDFDPVYITMEELEGINTELLKLDRKKEQLVEVEKRLINLDTLLYSLNPENFRASPVRKYLLSKESSVPYSWLITQVDDLNKEIQTFDTQLIQLEKKFADDARRERNNAIPVLQTTELTANLMYGLRSDTEDQKWLTVSQLDSILDGGRLQDAFLGLLQQRMSSSKGLGMINPGGLAQLVDLTIRDLPELPAFRQDSLQRKDSLAFYRKAVFTVNTMNRILELPLVVKPGTSGKFQPLKEQLPGMQNVPD